MSTKVKNTGLLGPEVVRKAMNHILIEPGSWSQADVSTECGTKHCFLGWCAYFSGFDFTKPLEQANLTEIIGIDKSTYDWLFYSYRTLGELYAFSLGFCSDKTVTLESAYPGFPLL